MGQIGGGCRDWAGPGTMRCRAGQQGGGIHGYVYCWPLFFSVSVLESSRTAGRVKLQPARARTVVCVTLLAG